MRERDRTLFIPEGKFEIGVWQARQNVPGIKPIIVPIETPGLLSFGHLLGAQRGFGGLIIWQMDPNLV